MTTQTISFVQEKGGAGKTTNLIIIATHMHQDGAKIAMIDTDQRQNLYRFCKKEKLDIDYKYIDDEKMISPTIAALKKAGYDAIFIDTEGYKSSLSTHVIAQSDIVFIPSKADESNAVCAFRTHKNVIAVANKFDKNIDAIIILSDIDPGTRITAAIKKEMNRHKIPILDTQVGHATGFKEMMSSGVPPAAGAARKYIQAIMCELQMKKILKYYNKGA